MIPVGIVFPHGDIGDDPDVIAGFVGGAEALGAAHVRVYDHVLGASHADRDPPLGGPYTEDTPFHELFVLLGFLAGRTTTIELVPGVLILPQRQTALVAKQAAEVDLLSRRRLRLGVGTGWNRVEYESLGVPFADRGARIEEQVELLRALWIEPLLDVEGTWHRVDRASILPRPGRRIPVWFGGWAPVARRRAARIGDGFLFGTPCEAVADAAAHLREELRRAGRENEPFGLDVLIPGDRGVDRWRRDVDAAVALGATHVTLSQQLEPFRSPEHRLENLAACLAVLSP